MSFASPHGQLACAQTAAHASCPWHTKTRRSIANRKSQIANFPGAAVSEMKPTTAALEARDVHLTYPSGSQALRGVSVNVARNEFVAIIGPNGAGKSTLLRALAGLQPVSSGTITIDGAPIETLSHLERARRIALVMQALDFVPGYNVADFV